jgi:putative restriction endonuclease
MLGKPHLVSPRLGQGGFRISVIDAFERRCSVTGERTLPALDAAYIRPFADVQRHEVVNGVTPRPDIHRLFDQGYVTIDPALRFRVSGATKTELENGRDYYALHERPIHVPPRLDDRPDGEALRRHSSKLYRRD